MPNLVVLGEALIDLFAPPGVGLRDAKTLQAAPGGAPANVAVALARLGAEVGFIGKVGADDYGAFLIDLMTDEGVDTRHFVADAGGPTMLAAVPSATEQQFILYSGASDLLRVEDLPPEYVTAAAIFIYGSVTLTGGSRAAALQAARWSRAAGRTVIFDVNLRPALWPDLDVARQRIGEGVASANVVKLNETELHFLTGSRDPAAGSQRLIEQGVQLCAVSLGAEGAYFNNGRSQGHAAAFPVPVQDTTGCGDAFVAGLSLLLSQSETPLDELDEPALTEIFTFANACGALAATQLGAMSALPTLAAVHKLLKL